jgi:antitoxin (DNA-binding transcriptional repressor) of toxin-antitoxin stability system
MTTITLEEAQARLAQLIEELGSGEVLTITRDERPIAQLTGTGASSREPRKLGGLRGTVLYMAPDFDAPLDELQQPTR